MISTGQPNPDAPREEQSEAERDGKLHRWRLFARANRGILFDMLIFLANLFLMRLLTGYFLDIYRTTSDDDPASQIPLALCCAAMLILPPTGAMLKRWHFHARQKATAGSAGPGRARLLGCLCNPILYFCVNLVVMSAVMTIAGQQIFGDEYRTNGGIFVTSILLGMTIVGAQTWLVYRYFSPPKREPRSRFLLDERSEIAGDICILINMAMFQTVWNVVTFVDNEPVAGIGDLAARLFFLTFVALLIYFPPRIFYLAEDGNRPIAWVTMLLANSPVILRVVIGTGSGWSPTW